MSTVYSDNVKFWEEWVVVSIIHVHDWIQCNYIFMYVIWPIPIFMPSWFLPFLWDYVTDPFAIGHSIYRTCPTSFSLNGCLHVLKNTVRLAFTVYFYFLLLWYVFMQLRKMIYVMIYEDEKVECEKWWATVTAIYVTFSDLGFSMCTFLSHFMPLMVTATLDTATIPPSQLHFCPFVPRVAVKVACH